MIRVVVDTNVLVSAILKPNGNEAQVVQAILEGAAEIPVTADIMAEYQDVLGRGKFTFAADRIARLLAGLEQRAVHVLPAEVQTPSPDPDDTEFIACAVAAGAQFLVTGNRRHFPEPFYGTAEVVNARQPLDRLAAPA